MTSRHILILGGGFGGLSTAHEIRSSLGISDVKITIIDKKDWFMMDLVKLWIIKGTRKFETSIRPLEKIKQKGIDFVNDEVIKIDAENNVVVTTGAKIYYDYLVIALGVELDSDKIPGLSKNGLVLYDINDVKKIPDELKNFDSGKLAFVIMGMPYKCPPAPFEAALIINSLLKERKVREKISINFYSPAPITMPAAGSDVSQQVLELLKKENISFHGLKKTTSIDNKKLKFEEGEAEFDLLLAIPPHKVPQVVNSSGFAQSGKFIQVNRDCKTTFDNVYAIGDVTSMMVTDNIAVPKAGIFAETQGIMVARNIVSKIRKEKESAVFDGKGGCFVEVGDNNAGYVEVDMFAKPNPITLLKNPASKYMQEKEKFEKERIEKWL